ncbi:Uncharacterised protein [Actinomyces bovis]|uniref:Uncharacterized protein n=1 Tax=Actinomyces bovis TaxID=1658 RepID=A0ABY1VLP8_9ACTO|nr:hypothetical protein [Actinomyces bovis]SPT52940.1 Uncharacterised protein [Actinomyces bovis]VEG55119.1 Uncharacterised protein [Actinomyces israelii]
MHQNQPSQNTEVRDTAVVFIAPPSQRPLLAALTDLSASGVLAPFHWIESVPEPRDNRSFHDPSTVAVVQGRSTVTSFAPVANRYGLTRVRLLVVVPVGHPSQDALSANAELHFQGLGIAGGAVRECVRVLVPWSDQPLPAELGHQGWNNVMLSPESTADPAYSANGWWQHPELVAGAAAVGLAAQAGICGAVERAPQENSPASGSTYVEVARSFVRVTDAHAVEDLLRGQVTKVGATYPQPIRGETQQWINAFPDPAGRVMAAAQTWHQRHTATLRRPMAELPASGAERSVGAWKAITLFFSFLAKAIMGAPSDWLRSRVRAMKTTVARSVAQTVFGEGSQVRVVVGGVDDTGQPVGWRELATAAANASATMPADFPSSGQHGARDFGALWKDLLDGSISLLSGSNCESLGIAAYEGYVPQRGLVAPSAAENSYVLQQNLGALPAGTAIAPWDALEVEHIDRALRRAAAGSDAQAQSAREQLGRLEQWRRTCEASFIPLLGRSLATTFEATRADIAFLSAQLQELVSQDLGPETERKQRRLAKILRLMLLALLVVVGVPLVLTLLGSIGWMLMAIISVVAIIVWLVASVITFVKRQREVFQLLFRAEDQEQRVPLLTANLRLAVEDLAAQGAAYSQFEQWATITTTFISDPLGERATQRTDREHETVLPAALQRVKVEAEPGHVADVAAELRGRVFRVGWLNDAWEAMYRTVKEDLTPEQRTRFNNRQLDLLTEQGTPGSAISNWAQALALKGVRSSAGAEHWTRCLEVLASRSGIELELEAVLPGQGRRRLPDYRRDLESAQPRSVVPDVLGAGARSGGRALTTSAGHWFAESNEGLSQTLVLVASTQPVPAADFFYPEPAGNMPSFRLEEPEYSGYGSAQPPSSAPDAESSAPSSPFGNLEY